MNSQLPFRGSHLSKLHCFPDQQLPLFLPAGHPAVTLSLVMLGKFGILAGLSVLYTFTGELFPTVIRSTALSTCATFSRVGSSVSPYLLQLGEIFHCTHHTLDCKY